ncbi:MAG: hypothetical protein ACXACR_16895, partial [Candidatus Hodarchaeales archaeon]
ASIAVDGIGNVHVAWEDDTNIYGAGKDDVDIFYKYWNLTTQTWSGRVNQTDVVSAGCTWVSTFSKIAIDSAGYPHVTWSDYTDLGWGSNTFNIFYRFWNPTTNSWTGRNASIDVVSGNYAIDCYRSEIAIDQADNVHIVWNEAPMWGDKNGTRILYRQLHTWEVQPTDKPIPGFEFLALLMALISLVILVRRKELT